MIHYTLHLKLLSPEDGEEIEEDVFECNMEGVPTDKTNLVIRALDLMREKTGNQDKVRFITLSIFNGGHHGVLLYNSHKEDVSKLTMV